MYSTCPPCSKLKIRSVYKSFNAQLRNVSLQEATSSKETCSPAINHQLLNLIAHTSKCFGEEAIASAMKVKDLRVACNVMKDKVNLRRSGSITATFKHVAQGRVTYSTRPATNLEVHTNHVHWMCESKRPFKLVKDPGYHLNMKTGRPQQYIPAPMTVA